MSTLLAVTFATLIVVMAIVVIILSQQILAHVHARAPAASANDMRVRIYRITISSFHHRQISAGMTGLAAIGLGSLVLFVDHPQPSTAQEIEHAVFVGLLGCATLVMILRLRTTWRDYRDQKRLDGD